MLVQRIKIVEYYAGNLEHLLTIPLRNTNPIFAMAARESRIFAFWKCANALRDLLEQFYEVIEQQPTRQAEKDLQEMADSIIDAEDLDNDQKMLLLFRVQELISEEDVDTLCDFLLIMDIINTPISSLSGKVRRDFIAESNEYIEDLPEFCGAVQRLLDSIINNS